MPENTKKELVLNETYKITITEEPISSVILTYAEKLKFKNLNSKSKLTRLEYLKSKRAIEKTLSKIVSQTKYVKLYKDNVGFHLRIEPDLEEEEFLIEMKIITYLLSSYSLHVNEEINTGMSGDINRILISKGTLIDE